MKTTTKKTTGQTAARIEPERTRLPLDKLKPHPKQTIYFPTPSPDRMDALKAELAGGQREPIHVMPPKNHAGLPAYTVLDGHCRLAIARELGWREIDVFVRNDLTTATAEVVESIFLTFNPARRQMTQIELCRVELRKLELRYGRRPSSRRVSRWARS